MKILKNIYRIHRYSAVVLFYFFKLSFLDQDRSRYNIVILCLFIRVMGFRWPNESQKWKQRSTLIYERKLKLWLNSLNGKIAEKVAIVNLKCHFCISSWSCDQLSLNTKTVRLRMTRARPRRRTRQFFAFPPFSRPVDSHFLKKWSFKIYSSVNVFGTKVLIGGTIFTSPTWEGTASLRGHPSHAKV